MNKIPVFSVLTDIYKETFSNMKRYLTLSIIWLCLMAVVMFFGFEYTQQLAVAEFYKMLGYPMPDHDIIQLKVMVYTLALTILGVFLIEGFTRSSMSGKNRVFFDMKSLLFLFKYFIIVILVMAVIIGIFMLGTPIISDVVVAWEITNQNVMLGAFICLILIALVVSMFFAIKLIMGLPNTFVEKPAELKAFWIKTKGNMLRIFAIMVMVAVPSFLITATRLISYSDMETGASFDMNVLLYESKIAYMIYMTLIFMCAPLYGTMLAKVYKALEIEGFVVPKKEKKTDETKKIEE